MSISSIEQVLKDRLEAASLGINKVVVGSKAQAQDFKPPLLWVLPATASITTEGLALHEVWSLRYWVIAVVSDFDPQSGLVRSRDLALDASKAVMTDPATGKIERQLGLDSIYAVRRASFQASDTRLEGTQENLHGAGVELVVTMEAYGNEEVK